MCTTLVLGSGCDRQPAPVGPAGVAASRPGPIVVAVPITPVATFVEKIGAARVKTLVIVAPGQSMHTYDPTPKQVAALETAAVYLSMGLPFEQRIVAKVESQRNRTRVVDLRRGLTLRDIEDEHLLETGAAHEHHDHGEKDPHIWLSPRMARVQAQTIADALCAADEAHADEYRRNLAVFQQELDELDHRIRGLLAACRSQAVFVYHPTYGYFCDDYGLRQVPVEISGREPTAKELAALIEKARREKVRVIFVQPQFSKKTAEALAAQIDGAVVDLDPLSAEYRENLEAIAKSIAATCD